MFYGTKKAHIIGSMTNSHAKLWARAITCRSFDMRSWHFFLFLFGRSAYAVGLFAASLLTHQVSFKPHPSQMRESALAWPRLNDRRLTADWGGRPYGHSLSYFCNWRFDKYKLWWQSASRDLRSGKSSTDSMAA